MLVATLFPLLFVSSRALGRSAAPVTAPTVTSCRLESDAGTPLIALDTGIDWFGFSRAAFSSTATGSYTFRARFTKEPTSARIDLAGGAGSVPLAPEGAGVWSATLTAAQILAGYDASDVNHNFVGFLRVEAADVFRLNVFVNVVDENVAPVTPIAIDGSWQRSCRVANVWDPSLTLPVANATLRTIAQQFYARFDDDFDFLAIVFTLPSFPANREHHVVRNNVAGLGLPMIDDTAAWGSAGALLGATRFPIATFFDLAENAANHELGHQWINYSALPALATGSPHWPIGSNARGPMGFSFSGGVGGQFPYDLVLQPNGDYRMVYTGSILPDYTDLDLYLMGFLPPDSVGTNFVFSDPDQPICDGCEGPVTSFTVEDVIASQGARVPDASTAQKRFRIGTIVVSRDRLLDATEMSMFEHFAQRGEAATPLPYSSGFSTGTTHPFRVATRGLGTLETWLHDACAPPVSVEPRAPEVSRLRFAGAHPGSASVALEWSLPARGSARLEIFSVAGQRVACLADGVLEVGVHRVDWAPDDATPAGIYFARLILEGRPAGSLRIVVAR